MTSKESANRGKPIEMVNPVESHNFKETKYKGYFVNSNGIVASVRDNKGRFNYDLPMRILKPNLSTSGYLQVYISYNNKKKSAFVHRLVIETFKGESDLTVDHIDGNKLNNNLDNLQYLPLEENTRKSSIGRKAWNRLKVKVTLDDNETSFESISDFCKFYGIRKLQISELIRYGVRKQNNSSKYFFNEVVKSQTTIEIHMVTNKNWKSKRIVE